MKYEDSSLAAASLRVAKKCGISQETAKKLLRDAQANLEAEALGFSASHGTTASTLDFDFTEKPGQSP